MTDAPPPPASPPPLDVGEAPRILIVRMSALGDVIHALPALDALRRRYPRARIGWIVEELSRDLVEPHPQVDEAFVIPKRRWRSRRVRCFFTEMMPFWRNVRRRGWDVAIDFQGLTKSGLAAWLSGARTRVGFGDAGCQEINGWFTNAKVVPPPGATHIIDRNLSLAARLGAPVEGWRRVLPDRPEWRAPIERWFHDEGVNPATRFVALNPGAGWPTKRWPVERFAQVGTRLALEHGRDILITWGPGEEDVAERIMRLMADRGAVSRLAPPTSIGESLALMRHVDLFIGGDTGPTHLAAAADVPVVTIFGASDGQRNHPGGRRQVVLQNLQDCDGVPCWKRSEPDHCRLECLLNITTDEVYDAAARLLANDEETSTSRPPDASD